MSEWFDKIKSEDIENEIFPDLILDDDTSDSYTKFYKEIGLPVRCALYLHPAEDGLEDFDILRKLKIKMLKNNNLRISPLHYFVHHTSPGKYIRVNEDLNIKTLDALIAIFYIEKFDPNKLDSIIQILKFTECAAEKYKCFADFINYDNETPSSFDYEETLCLIYPERPKSISKTAYALTVASCPFDIEHTDEMLRIERSYKKKIKQFYEQNR